MASMCRSADHREARHSPSPLTRRLRSCGISRRRSTSSAASISFSTAFNSVSRAHIPERVSYTGFPTISHDQEFEKGLSKLRRDLATRDEELEISPGPRVAKGTTRRYLRLAAALRSNSCWLATSQPAGDSRGPFRLGRTPIAATRTVYGVVR